jgi:4-coumarate--CoA ligase
LQIIDDDGNALDTNEIGEIYLLTAVRFLGYANNLEETRNAFDKEGWFKTGDLGYINDEGDIFVVDRKKDMIKYLNYQVAPSELENFIISIDGVLAVCVVGIPDMLCGDLAVAVIVKDINSELTEQDIIEEVSRNFPPFKRLHGGAYFMDGMPLTPSGKIKKREVRKLAARMYKSIEINGNY